MAARSVNGKTPVTLVRSSTPALGRDSERSGRAFVGLRPVDTMEACANVARFMGDAVSAFQQEGITAYGADAVHSVLWAVADAMEFEAKQGLVQRCGAEPSGSVSPSPQAAGIPHSEF